MSDLKALIDKTDDLILTKVEKELVAQARRRQDEADLACCTALLEIDKRLWNKRMDDYRLAKWDAEDKLRDQIMNGGDC